MAPDREVFLKSLFVITSGIAKCLEISPIPPPSSFVSFASGKGLKEEVQE